MCKISDGLVLSDGPFLTHGFRLAGTSQVRSLLAPAKSTKIPSEQDFRRFLLRVRADAETLLSALVANDIDPRQWADEFKLLLNDGHASAWVLGRRRGGDFAEAGETDELIGTGYADTQADFLLNFLDDLQGDRYLDDEGQYIADHIRNRTDLYIQNMRGTSGAAFVAASDPEEEYEWSLNDFVEEHCTDCPDLASQSPWDESTLFAYPGDGNTACLGNCKCKLVRQSDGRASFDPVDL